MKLHPRSMQKIPLANSLISAGPAVEIGDDFHMLDVAELITGGREGFAAFTVTGDSAAPEILPGYTVFVDTFAQPRNGAFVAVVVNGLTCVKTFTADKHGLYLVSQNTKYPAREIHAEDSFHVLGVVRGALVVFR